MRRLRVPLLVILAVLALAVLALVVGWRLLGAADGTYRTQRQLEQVPEEHLFYPGAAVLTHGGRDRELDFLGQRSRAFSGYVLGTSAIEDAVLAFYRERLTAAGWRDAPTEVSLSSGQARGKAYRQGQLLFQITILRKGDVRNDPALDAYQTPYQIVLRGDLPR